MLVTLIVVSALLAGAVVVATMQVSSTRSSDVTRTGTAALYCAEAGLSAARPVVANNYPSWAGSLYTGTGTPTEPAWLAAGIGSHDLSGGSGSDFMVYLKDNDDEIGSNNGSSDNDLRIFIVSRCLKYGDTVKEVEELITYSGGGSCYHSQNGNCFGNNNAN
jgi:hypothetical protein